MALGVTMQLPIDDKHSYNKDYLLAQLAILMAGRIAEEMFMHHMTTGAGNDIERATDLARKMVCEWGMSELGPLSFGKKEEQIFLGREIAQHRDYSEETAIRIDEQVKKLVQGGYDTRRSIIEEHSEALVTHRRNAAGARNPGRQRSDAAHRGPDPAAACHRRRRTPRMQTQQVIRPEGGRRVPGPVRRGASAAGVIPAFPVYLFDIDGTLLDSRPGYLRRRPAGAGRQPLPADVTFDYLKGYIGRHLFDLFADVFPDPTQEQMDELLAQYRTIYLAPRAQPDHGLSRAWPKASRRSAAARPPPPPKARPTTRAVLEQFGLIQLLRPRARHRRLSLQARAGRALHGPGSAGRRARRLPVRRRFRRRHGSRPPRRSEDLRRPYGYGKREDLAQFTPDYWIDDLRELTPQAVRASRRRNRLAHYSILRHSTPMLSSVMIRVAVFLARIASVCSPFGSWAAT